MLSPGSGVSGYRSGISPPTAGRRRQPIQQIGDLVQFLGALAGPSFSSLSGSLLVFRSVKNRARRMRRAGSPGMVNPGLQRRMDSTASQVFPAAPMDGFTAIRKSSRRSSLIYKPASPTNHASCASQEKNVTPRGRRNLTHSLHYSTFRV